MRTLRHAGENAVRSAARLLGLGGLREGLTRRRQSTVSAAVSGLESLPEITFDLSFLSEPPPPGLATSGTNSGDGAVSGAELPAIAFDLSSLQEAARHDAAAASADVHWRGRCLEEWFRERTAAVAERARERRQPSSDGFAAAGRAG
jgi:hypothetical protein